MEYFCPYEGDQPYIFVSYAHANSPQVMEVITHMHSRGYRIWYDEGIEVGSEWPECIASHLAGAHLMLAFISNAYMASDNCRREMHFAISRKIKIINIFLEDTRMTPGMEMQIGNIFALMKQSMSDTVFFQKLYAAPLLNSEAFAAAPGETAAPSAPAVKPEEKRPRREKAAKPPKPPRAKPARPLWRRVLALCLLLALLGGLLALGIVGYSTGLGERLMIQLRTEPVERLPGNTKAAFEEELFARIARAYTGKETGDIYVSDLAGMNTLYISGDVFACGEEKQLSLDWDAELTPGENGPEKLPLSLGDLKYFTGLQKLRIQDRALASLESLPACGLEALRIDGCGLCSLEGVGRLTELRELSVGDWITELGDLENCLQLRSLKLTTNLELAPLKPLTKIAEIEITGSSLESLRTLMRGSKISAVTLRDCDLRGSFFKRFDRERRIVSLCLDHCQLNSTVNLDDFTGLTTLTLLSTGEELDWSLLSKLPVLSRVYYDAPMAETLGHALSGTTVQLIPVEGA